MVKKTREIQLNIIYSRYGQTIEETYRLQRDVMAQGIDYQKIQQYRDKFVKAYGIRTEVRMNYLSDDEQVRSLTENFKLSYLEIQRQYEGTLVILLRAEIDCVMTRIEQLQVKLDNVLKEIESLKKEKSAAIEISQDTSLKKHPSQPDRPVIKAQSAYFPERGIDVGIMFSEPLVHRKDQAQPIKLSAEPVKFRQEIERLKHSLTRTVRGQITMKCLIASVQKLEYLLKLRVQILHIICHGLVEVEKKTGIEEGVLCFEQLHNIGYMDKIYGRQIPDLIKIIPEQYRPKLVFINACHSELIGDAFLKSGIPYVVAIQSSEKIEDTAAQLFAEKFYNSLFNGVSVRKSFDDAKDSLDRQNRPVSSNICCCFHPNLHQPGCLWKVKVEQLGQQRCHELFHIPVCKCIKRHLNIHQLNCSWALQTLFNINKDFKIKQGQSFRQPTSQQISAYPYLLICCCSNLKRNIPHDQSQKFKFKHLKDANPDEVLFAPTIIDMESEVYDTTPNELRKDCSKGEKLFGRNMDIFNLIGCIRDKPRVIIVSGSVGSGRSGVVSKAVTYLIQRGYFKDEYYNIDLSNCSKTIDFEFCLIKKIGNLKCPDLHEALRKLATKDMVLVLDNADLFLNTSYEEFIHEVNTILDVLKNTKVIIIVSDKTSKQYDNPIFGEKRFYLEPLKKFAAADMFLLNAKQCIADINMKDIWKLFEDEKVRSPKTILDMVHFIKNQYSATNKVSISVLADYVEKIKNNVTSAEKFLEQNLKNLRKNPDVFQLFLFIAQFQGGLTELDFSIMSKQQGQDEMPQLHRAPSEPVLKRNESDIFLSPNWKNLINELLAENSENKTAIAKEFMKEGEYYYCVVEQRAEGFKNIRVKKYILEYLKKFDDSFETELKFKALAYLSNFSSILVRLFKEKYYYHQQLVEYSNISRCGFFQYDKSMRYACYYDENDYFPDATLNLSRSISKGREIDSEIAQILNSNKTLLDRHPGESVVQHQQNFLQMYKNDYSQYYKTILKSQKKKLFKHYYHSILLNIPTLVKIAHQQQTSGSFLRFCIDESLKKVNQLQPPHASLPTQNMYLIKLLFMRVHFQIYHNHPPKQMPVYRTYFQSIKRKMMWEETQDITQVEALDYYFLKICIHYQHFKEYSKPETYRLILSNSAHFKSATQQVKDFNCCSLIVAKHNLLMLQVYLTLCDKVELVKSLEEFRHTYDYGKKAKPLQDSLNIFRLNKLKQLEADMLVCLARININLLKRKATEDVNIYFDIRKFFIKPCRQLVHNQQYKLNSKDYEKQLNDLQEKLNSKIFQITKNFLIFMKANPIVYAATDTVIVFNAVKKSYKFRSAIQAVLCPGSETSSMTLKQSRQQKQVSVRFDILTYQKLKGILTQGCSILVVKFNTIQENDDLWLQFERDDLPVEQKVNLTQFLQKVSFNSINVLVISGENSKRVAERIAADPDAPLVISIELVRGETYIVDVNFFEYGYEEFSIRTLQRIASNYFISRLCEKIVYSDTNKRINTEDIITLVSWAKEQTIVYMLGFSKNTNNEEKVNKIIRISVDCPKSKNIDLEFQNGLFHDVSIQKSSLNNVKTAGRDFYVGREKLLLAVVNELLNNLQDNNPTYINLYGSKGCGKSGFVEELASSLLERGHFRSGIYIMSGWQIEAKHKGNINEYLQKHKKQIFPITYLNEQKVDASKMLIIIDDFHALKDRSNYLDYFFNSMYTHKVSFILTSNDQISQKTVPDFTGSERKLVPMNIKKLSEAEAALLSFMYIPLYDYEEYKDQFKTVFANLKKKQQNLILPRLVIEEFKKILESANKKNVAIKYKNYKDYFEGNIETLKLGMKEAQKEHYHHQQHDDSLRKRRNKPSSNEENFDERRAGSARIKTLPRLENNYIK